MWIFRSIFLAGQVLQRSLFIFFLKGWALTAGDLVPSSLSQQCKLFQNKNIMSSWYHGSIQYFFSFNGEPCSQIKFGVSTFTCGTQSTKVTKMSRSFVILQSHVFSLIACSKFLPSLMKNDVSCGKIENSLFHGSYEHFSIGERTYWLSFSPLLSENWFHSCKKQNHSQLQGMDQSLS